MLAWLLLLAAVMATVLGFAQAASDSVALPALPVAGLVLAGLLAVYALTLRSQRDAEGWFDARTRVSLLAAVLIAAALYALDRIPKLIPVGSPSVSATAPPQAQTDTEPAAIAGNRSVRIRRNDRGQFLARADINGAPVTVLIDTGASVVLLKQSDAEKAGIDTSALAYTVAVDTANGTTYAAATRIRSIAIGPVRLDGIEALVAKPGSLNESLLGMSFLRRLQSNELSGEFLTLRN
ncbi:MAG: retropepsin-like aspartic protease family protein [Hyphomicrobium sp.]